MDDWTARKEVINRERVDGIETLVIVMGKADTRATEAAEMESLMKGSGIVARNSMAVEGMMQANGIKATIVVEGGTEDGEEPEDGAGVEVSTSCNPLFTIYSILFTHDYPQDYLLMIAKIK